MSNKKHNDLVYLLANQWQADLTAKLTRLIKEQLADSKVVVDLNTAEIQKVLEKAKLKAAQELLLGLTAEASDFYYNKPNDYGVVTLKASTGKGDPFEGFCGEALLGEYQDGIKPNGLYRLSPKAVKTILKQSYRITARQAKLQSQLKKQNKGAN